MKLLKIRIQCAVLTASIVIRIACIWAADVWRAARRKR